MGNPTKGMTAEQKATFKADLVNQYRVKAAMTKEGRAGVAQLEAEQGAVVDTIVSAFGPGPHKLDGDLVKARKVGEHYQFTVMDLSKVTEL